MKAKKTAPKRIVWPPRMTPKRKRAVGLLQEWADKNVEVEYSAGPGAKFTGTISEMHSDERRTSFLFRNDFGVNAPLSTDLYDRIEIAEISDTLTNVGFFRNDAFDGGFSVSRKDDRGKQEKNVERVFELFRRWERLETMLMVHTGDGMRITVARGKVKELSDTFLFTIADTETIHLVVPGRSSSIYIDAKGNELTVLLHNEKSGLHFSVTNRLENPEDAINRLWALTTLVQ
jgi:hypothetical protein